MEPPTTESSSYILQLHFTVCNPYITTKKKIKSVLFYYTVCTYHIRMRRIPVHPVIHDHQVSFGNICCPRWNSVQSLSFFGMKHHLESETNDENFWQVQSHMQKQVKDSQYKSWWMFWSGSCIKMSLQKCGRVISDQFVVWTA